MLFNPVRNVVCVYVFVLLLSVFGRVGSSEATSMPEDDDEWEEEDPSTSRIKAPEGVQTLSFHPANLSDEDIHSTHMPEDLRCDGCRIIAYLMTNKLRKAHIRHRTHRLSESDLIDSIDQVCMDEDKKFEEYGVKEVKGKKRLSGEGLETKDEPGIMQGGGRWPHRLHEMCEQFVGELGEERIYMDFLRETSLETLLCYSEENGQICPPKDQKKDPKIPNLREKAERMPQRKAKSEGAKKPKLSENLDPKISDFMEKAERMEQKREESKGDKKSASKGKLHPKMSKFRETAEKMLQKKGESKDAKKEKFRDEL